MFTRETRVVMDAVRNAGVMTMEYFAQILSGKTLEERRELAADPRTVATVADSRSEEIMIAHCRAELGDGISTLGEETGYRSGDARRLVVDGIDGTLGFVHGIIGGWGILAAWEENGRITSAVVGIPSTDEYVIAERGTGCFHEYGGASRRLSGTAIVDLSGAIIGMWRSDADPSLRILNCEPFPTIRGRCLEVCNFLCSAITIRALALGAVHGLVVPWHKYWDFVCTRLVAEELGGALAAFPVGSWEHEVLPSAFAAVRGKDDKFNILTATNRTLCSELRSVVQTALA